MAFNAASFRSLSERLRIAAEARNDGVYEVARRYDVAPKQIYRWLELQDSLTRNIEASGWFTSAACRGKPVDWWFPERDEESQMAVQICRQCNVRAECLQWALDHGERDGIWGGLTAEQREPLLQWSARRPNEYVTKLPRFKKRYWRWE